MRKHLRIIRYSNTSEKDYTPYALVFLLAICARIIFLIWIDEPILFFKYPYFAEKLAKGKDIGERIVDLSPFYLYFLTFLRKIFGMEWASAKLIQSFVGAFNALLIMALETESSTKQQGFLPRFSTPFTAISSFWNQRWNRRSSFSFSIFFWSIFYSLQRILHEAPAISLSWQRWADFLRGYLL
jgi:hypothetical protein